MNIIYKNNKVQKMLDDFPTLLKKCSKHALQIKRRMDQLKAFTNLKEFMNSGLDNPHFEHGDMHGMIGWDVNQNVRLLFAINEKLDEEFMSKLDNIKDIIVVGVLDYHGEKKNWIIS